MKACNLKKGNIVQINNTPYQVKHIDVQTPSARGANTLYKVRYSSVPGGQKLDQTHKGNEMLEEMELERRSVNFLYNDQDTYNFMDNRNYEQYEIPLETMEDQAKWLTDGLEGITVLLRDGNPICIELPASVTMEIVETAPAIKGATVTNQSKPATLANGHVIQIPEYMEAGEIVQVNTETGLFMSRVKS